MDWTLTAGLILLVLWALSARDIAEWQRRNQIRREVERKGR